MLSASIRARYHPIEDNGPRILPLRYASQFMDVQHDQGREWEGSLQVEQGIHASSARHAQAIEVAVFRTCVGGTRPAADDFYRVVQSQQFSAGSEMEHLFATVSRYVVREFDSDACRV